uniref:Uncharacterized protein n=1 Tax=Arundo donax TaxID=35708 RepID=A0A0A9BF53_ARUDO
MINLVYMLIDSSTLQCTKVHILAIKMHIFTIASANVLHVTTCWCSVRHPFHPGDPELGPGNVSQKY